VWKSGSEIRAVQDVKLARMVSMCAEYHPYYAKQFRSLGISPSDIQTVEELEKLPLTQKADLMAAPDDFRLRLEGFDSFESSVWDIVYTTGTTAGKPTPIFNTAYDFYAILEMYRRMNDIRGIGPKDVVANLLPLTRLPHGAFLRYTFAPLTSGARLIAPMPGSRVEGFSIHRSLDEAIRMTEEHRATVLVGVPSFLRRFLIRAEELGMDGSSIRLLCLVGEPVSDGLREDLRRRSSLLGARDVVVSASYGATETQCGFVECAEHAGMHNPAPDFLFVEIVDPDSGRRLPDGERGMVAITHLDRRGTVLLRYLLGDLAVLTHEPCPVCGRLSERILGIPERRHDLVKVKGMLINPQALCDRLVALPGIEEFQVRITKEVPGDPYSMDVLVIRVATRASDSQHVGDQVRQLTKELTGVTPRVEYVDRHELHNPEGNLKAKRFIDERRGK